MKSFRKERKEKPIIIGNNNKRRRHGFFSFLKNFNFPDLSDSPKVKFLNKFSLLFHGLLACILVFAIECVSRHSFTSAVSFCISSPLTFLYNALLIFATLLIVYLFKHRALVRIVISIFWMLLGVINGCVLASRVTPFNFADLKLIGDLLSMKNSKYLSAGQEIAVVILLIALATSLILLHSRDRNSKEEFICSATLVYWYCAQQVFLLSQRQRSTPISFPDTSEIWHRDIRITVLYTVFLPVWQIPA